ncbi:MAG: HAMP domain-containing histidine kinase [Lachnospiraceae bacterium]|nr:HAMP domain-containing histidine kinase [Lachnospiraceae bacterium]
MSSDEKRKTKKTRGLQYGRLFLRTYLSFGAVVVAFSLILGVLFMRLFEKANISEYQADLKQKTVNVATKCSQFYRENAQSKWITYLINLQDIEGMEVWIWTNADSSTPLWPHISEDPKRTRLGQGYVDAVLKAFEGEVVVNTGLNTTNNTTSILCAAPVLGREAGEERKSEIIGAAVLSTNVDAQRGFTDTGFRIIEVSIVIALIATFIIAIPVVGAITHPISRIRITAQTLADGDYTVKTGIDRRDEIGELASTVDLLAGKLSENEIERKNMDQTRMDFFANVSHELRTPITVVRAYAESLKDGVVTKQEKVQQYYDRMLSECINMERLVGDLLTLSKMQNPDFVIEKEPVDLRQVIMDLIRAGKTLADEKNVKILYSGCTTPCIMDADYGRLRQMFLVIIDNAIKFSSDGGKVVINVEKINGNIITSIKDEGVGMSEEELPFIFEKFYKSKLRQNAKGSGLGLAIAKQICIKHNGTINVTSEKGVGTCFTFVFPERQNVQTLRR